MILNMLIAMLVMVQPNTEITSPCAYNSAAMMALAEREFDQDMQGGWRKVAASGCDLEAADLIKDWRTRHNSNSTTLFWHEGQLRASAGQNNAAIILFEKARKDAVEDAEWGWNLYVDGSIAFLNNDKLALLAARKTLASLPEPESLKSMVDVNGQPAKVKWPMNLHVLDAFIQCWGLSYKQAYACTRPSSPESKTAP
jgi:hypothetical protein